MLLSTQGTRRVSRAISALVLALLGARCRGQSTVSSSVQPVAPIAARVLELSFPSEPSVDASVIASVTRAYLSQDTTVSVLVIAFPVPSSHPRIFNEQNLVFRLDSSDTAAITRPPGPLGGALSRTANTPRPSIVLRLDVPRRQNQRQAEALAAWLRDHYALYGDLDSVAVNFTGVRVSQGPGYTVYEGVRRFAFATRPPASRR
jgi:hypothetical protein